ncbi:MAG: PASTA domain-containing protein [Gaiellaceae bacterium]
MRAVALLFLIVALAAGCGGSDGSSLVVPTFVGLRASVATGVAEQFGLKPEVTYGKNSEIRKGFVYSQSLKVGSKAREGDMLTLSVSSGQP